MSACVRRHKPKGTTMTRKKIQDIATTVAVAAATVLTWLSGFIVMQIVYRSTVASIVFGTVCAIIVFCQCRFSYVSLMSDGRIKIQKDEIKNNIWHILSAVLVALLVALPLALKLYADEVAAGGADLAAQMQALASLFPSQWLPLTALALGVVALFLVPIFIKMSSEEPSGNAQPGSPTQEAQS